MASGVGKRMPPPGVRVVADPVSGLMNVPWYDFFKALSALQVTLDDYPNDVQAAAGGVPLYGMYRSGSTVKVRVS